MSRKVWLSQAVVSVGFALALFLSTKNVASAAEPASPPTASGYPDDRSLTVPGKTFPAPGRISEIAACVMHPVERVLVRPGDVVRAGQPLIEIDSDEPRAEVRAKQAEVKELAAGLARLKAQPRAEERAQARAELESTQIEYRAAQAHLARLDSLRAHDAVSEREHRLQQTLVLRSAADERAAQAHLDYLLKLPIEQEIAEAEARLAVAQAELESAQFDLEHYTVHAAIDGIVCRLDVTPGTVNRAGTKVWGEIIDLSEVDVQAELSPRQLSEIDLSQPVEVRQTEPAKSWSAKFVYVAPAANRETGCIPVIVRVTNAGEPLRCYLNVSVRFRSAAQDGSTASQTSPAIQSPPAE